MFGFNDSINYSGANRSPGREVLGVTRQYKDTPYHETEIVSD